MVDAFVAGALVTEEEVLDIDEAAFRDDRLASRLYGTLLVPEVRTSLQPAKAASDVSAPSEQVKADIARSIVEELDPQTLHLLGPGTTVRAITEELELSNTLLGLDAVHEGTLVGEDVNEKDILRLLEQHRKRKIIVTPIGGNGFIFGRGSKQFTPTVIWAVGKENVIVVGARRKVNKLECLRVDTGDATLDETVSGYVKVTVGYREWMMVEVSMVEQPIRLDRNEVTTLPPPHVVAGAGRGLSRLNRYADPEDLARFRGLLAHYAGVPEQQLVMGPGSDLLLREMIHAFGGERMVITVSPTFLPTVETVRQVAARWTGLRLSPPTFALEPEVLMRALEGPCLAIIDNPNNPTGQVLLDRETVRAVLQSEQTLLVIDEAYHDFSRVSARGEERPHGSFADLVEEYTNLAVTRTLDKAFSLAGARVGYAVVGEAFREAFIGFYAFLPQSSLHAGIEALEDPGYARDTVGRLVVERERLREALRDAGARVIPSHTNFLLVRSDILDMARRLRDAGVLVSDVSNQLPPGFIRVTVGTQQENDAFLVAFEEIIGEGE